MMKGFLSSISVITVDRLLVIMFPFGGQRLDKHVTWAGMAAIWLFVALLAALPLTKLEYFDNFYGRSGVCLALHITNEKASGWQYSVLIFVGNL